MEIKPLGKNVVVELLGTLEDKTPSGIALPQNLKDDSSKSGKVIAIGKEANDNISIGDLVLLPQYSMQKIKVDGKEFYVLSSEDILAVIK